MTGISIREFTALLEDNPNAYVVEVQGEVAASASVQQRYYTAKQKLHKIGHGVKLCLNFTAPDQLAKPVVSSRLVGAMKDQMAHRRHGGIAPHPEEAIAYTVSRAGSNTHEVRNALVGDDGNIYIS